MHLKVFLKLKKNPKTLSSGQKKPKKPKKTQKTQKNPLGWVFLKKKQGFFQPWLERTVNCNFTGDNCNERGWACTPHPYQPAVLRIRDVYPGSRIRLFSIPDPGSELSPSRIPDPHQRN
jgi:hypothetical protein